MKKKNCKIPIGPVVANGDSKRWENPSKICEENGWGVKNSLFVNDFRRIGYNEEINNLL